MNSTEALREIAEKWGHATWNETTKQMDVSAKFLSDLNALISEHYISKEEHEKERKRLLHCHSCGTPLSRDCPHCKELWET